MRAWRSLSKGQKFPHLCVPHVADWQGCLYLPTHLRLSISHSYVKKSVEIDLNGKTRPFTSMYRIVATIIHAFMLSQWTYENDI